jgi:hypothetical protein
MSSPLRILRALAVSLAVCSIAGCYISTVDDRIPLVATGRLTLRWSIDGTMGPDQCRQLGATSIRISIFNDGTLVSDYVQDCDAFATTIDLNPDNYTGSVHLEDSSTQPRTTNVELFPFRIIGGTNLDVPVDFPANSFY